MRTTARVFGFVIAATLLACIPQTGIAKVYLDDFDEDAAASLMLQEVNTLRYREGLPLLGLDDSLSVSCRRHALDMALRDYFDHFSPEGVSPADRAREMGVVDPVSENIGISRTFGRDLGEVVHLLMRGFLDSAGHRKNLLDPDVTHVGIGFYQDVDDTNKRLSAGRDPDSNYQGFGTVLVVQEFYARRVRVLEPSPYRGRMKPGEFVTLRLDFADDVDEAFLRIAPRDDPARAFDVPMSKGEKGFQARFAIGNEGDFRIGIYANSPQADWFYREEGRLELTVKSGIP